MAAPFVYERRDRSESEDDEPDVELLDDEPDRVIRTRHGRPSKKAGKREANKQLAAAQQLVALPIGRLKPLLPELDERITDAVFLARNMKRSRGMQRQIALVAKLLRDEVDPVTLDALQNRQVVAATAAGKESGGGASASERLALSWRAALTGEEAFPVPSGAADAPLAGDDTAGAREAAAAAVEAEVMAAAESALTASGRIPGGHFVDMAELRRLIRQAREEQEAGTSGGASQKPKTRGRSRAGRRLLAELRPLAVASLAGG